jgi:hypothetical protein
VTTNTNYWSLLSCPVDKQNEDDDNLESNQQILSFIATPKSKNKIAEKWKQRIARQEQGQKKTCSVFMTLVTGPRGHLCYLTKQK